jgi:uncharacterized membrane protein
MASQGEIGAATGAGDGSERDERLSAARLGAFSDAVNAVIYTIMVLELKAPDVATLGAITSLWPAVLSYAVSYLFIAIIWINHHHLMRFVRAPTTRLIWLNFAHLFLVSFVPFATQWVARTRLAWLAVVGYACVFVAVDLAYLAFERAVLAQADCSQLSDQARRRARFRSLLTLAIFAAAGVTAVWAPLGGVALICLALSFFVRPQAPGIRLARRRPAV